MPFCQCLLRFMNNNNIDLSCILFFSVILINFLPSSTHFFTRGGAWTGHWCLESELVRLITCPAHFNWWSKRNVWVYSLVWYFSLSFIGHFFFLHTSFCLPLWLLLWLVIRAFFVAPQWKLVFKCSFNFEIPRNSYNFLEIFVQDNLKDHCWRIEIIIIIS